MLTPLGGRISVGSPIDSYSGAIFEADKNDGVETLSSCTENVYVPEGYPGGEYYFYVDMLAEKGAIEEWSLEVTEFGETVYSQTGSGHSKFFKYVAAECVIDDHCRENDFCFENRCIVDGTPRFTLSWEGDDDLDLSVNPPVGSRVDYCGIHLFWY